MPPGRKPKPIEQKQREGNAGKRALPEPLKMSPGTPVKPPDLPPAGEQLWDELIPMLVRSGVVERVDAAAMTAVCVEWARAEAARRVIAKEGLFARGSMGQLVEHPARAIEKEAHAMFLRFAEQYGLTAAARARIATARGSDAADEELADVIDMQPELRVVGD